MRLDLVGEEDVVALAVSFTYTLDAANIIGISAR